MTLEQKKTSQPRRNVSLAAAAGLSAVTAVAHGTVLMRNEGVHASGGELAVSIVIGAVLSAACSLFLGGVAEHDSGWRRALLSFRLAVIVTAISFWAPRITATPRHGELFALLLVIANLPSIVATSLLLALGFFILSRRLRISGDS